MNIGKREEIRFEAKNSTKTSKIHQIHRKYMDKTRVIVRENHKTHGSTVVIARDIT